MLSPMAATPFSAVHMPFIRDESIFRRRILQSIGSECMNNAIKQQAKFIIFYAEVLTRELLCAILKLLL